MHMIFFQNLFKLGFLLFEINYVKMYEENMKAFILIKVALACLANFSPA